MYAEPFADSSAVATWLICREARRHITVALSGDGGDEAFAGYDRHRAMHLAATMRPWTYLAVRLAAGAAGLFASPRERSPLARLVRFAGPLSEPPASQYFRYRSLFSPDDLRRLMTDSCGDAVARDAPKVWFCDVYEGCPDDAEPSDEVGYAQRHDLLTYLPDDLLVKTDIASMACSLELRAPLLDPKVVSLGLSLPAPWKVSRSRGKTILRDAFADLLPPQVLSRPKRGFGVPLRRWLAGDLFNAVRETLNDPWLYRQGVLRQEAVAGLLNDHYAGIDDHSHRIWAILILARWLARR
jgi:asparagine synthase (glutamine-hydrolysing)